MAFEPFFLCYPKGQGEEAWVVLFFLLLCGLCVAPSRCILCAITTSLTNQIPKASKPEVVEVVYVRVGDLAHRPPFAFNLETSKRVETHV